MMIDSERTHAEFGYFPSELSKGSHKRIYAICDDCGVERAVEFKAYRDFCPKCVNDGERHTNFGKHLAEETRLKIAAAHIGQKHTLESCMKMSISRSGEKNHFFGKKHTAETIQKQSNAKKGKPNLKLRGRPLSEEHCRRIADSKKGKPGWNKGIPHSIETRQKMKANHADYKKEKHPNWSGGTRVSHARHSALRREKLGFILINECREDDWVGHHIDQQHVVFIPDKIHKSVWHSVLRDFNMDIINDKVWDWYWDSYLGARI